MRTAFLAIATMLLATGFGFAEEPAARPAAAVETAPSSKAQPVEEAEEKNGFLAMPRGSRFGLAMNLNRADIRYELDADNAVGGHLGLEVFGSGFKSHNFSFGGYYMRRVHKPEPVGLHYLGGISTEASDDGLLEEHATISVYVGLGAEYFLPGTDRFSIEGSVGVAILFKDRKIKPNIGGQGNIERGTGFAIRDLTGGMLMVRYYFE